MERHNIRRILNVIIAKIQNNIQSVWEPELDETKEVVILEDFNRTTSDEPDVGTLEYNGWYDDLENLIKSI